MFIFMKLQKGTANALRSVKKNTGKNIATQIREALEVHMEVLKIDREVEKKELEDSEWERLIQQLI